MSSAARELVVESLTLKAWGDLPEDEPGELVDGCLEEEEMGDYTHETASSWLTGELRLWLKGRPGGFAGTSEARFGVSPSRGRKPDLTVFLPGGNVPPRRGLITVPPDIAVEIVSPTPKDQRRDRIQKPVDYAGFGVRWYWLLDPALRSFEVWELREGVYAQVLAVADGVAEGIPGCDGLRLDLPALWAEIDRLGPES